MKKIIISSLCIVFFTFCFSQNASRLILKGLKLKPGQENIFEYHPIPNLSLPDKIAASILYKNKGTFHNKIIEAKKTGNNYQFSFNMPDATSVLIIGMVDNRQYLANFSPLLAIKKNVIDNNNGSGFIYYPDNRTKQQQGLSKIVLADLLENKAEYLLDIISSTTYLLQLYEEAYKLNPALKKENSYVDYLSVLYGLKKDSVKSQLIGYAEQIQKTTKDEIQWRNAARIYSWLKMEAEVKQINTNILSVFPNGELVKEQYWEFFYKSKDYNEKSILSLMTDYIQRFNDSSAASKDKFYYQLVTLFIADSNWKGLFHYENFFDNKFGLNYSYNKQALKLCGEELDSQGTNLGIAKIISKKAVDFAQGKLREAEQNNEMLDESQGEYNRYVNTYALILYKLKQFDSAYYYQNIIYQQSNALNTKGFERYAAYAEKVKGLNFAKQLVEGLLIKGINSKTLEKQLASIYKQLNISPDEFTKLQKISDSLFWEKNEALIKAKYGSVKATEFSLSNILNEAVSLNSFTNKVVVLDFWANWCGPCKASFPMMKRIIEKYKNDNDIVFLFIDTWEREAPQTNLEKTKQYMLENKYPFNVLFDVNNKVVTDYKITGIPTKVIINKKGEIINVDENLEMLSDEEVIKNISFFIEAAKK